MTIKIIAISENRESWENENSFWYKEYAINELNTYQEKEEIVSKYGMREIYKYSNPCVSMWRRVDSSNGKIKIHDWNVMWCENGILKTALTLTEDYYINGISLDPIHKKAIELIKLENSLKNELKQLEDKITPCKYEKYSPLLNEYLYKYESELKVKKLWRKAQNNKAPMEIISEIKNRLNNEYVEELNRINTRIETIQQQLEDLKNL